MVTFEQAMTEQEFHWGGLSETTTCTAKRVERWRRNGVTKTWKTQPGKFMVPVKFGLRSYSYITNTNAHEFHVASECPVQGG